MRPRACGRNAKARKTGLCHTSSTSTACVKGAGCDRGGFFNLHSYNFWMELNAAACAAARTLATSGTAASAPGATATTTATAHSRGSRGRRGSKKSTDPAKNATRLLLFRGSGSTRICGRRGRKGRRCDIIRNRCGVHIYFIQAKNALEAGASDPSVCISAAISWGCSYWCGHPAEPQNADRHSSGVDTTLRASKS